MASSKVKRSMPQSWTAMRQQVRRRWRRRRRLLRWRPNLAAGTPSALLAPSGGRGRTCCTRQAVLPKAQCNAPPPPSAATVQSTKWGKCLLSSAVYRRIPVLLFEKKIIGIYLGLRRALQESSGVSRESTTVLLRVELIPGR